MLTFGPSPIHELRKLLEYLSELNAGVAELEDAGGRKRCVIGINASATQDKTIDQVTHITNRRRRSLVWDVLSETTKSSSAQAGKARPTASRMGPPLRATISTTGELTEENTVLYAYLGGQLRLNAYSSILEQSSVLYRDT